MLDFQLQQFPFRFGLDEGTDPNQQPPGRLTTAENAEWVKGGRLQKRDGIESLSSTLTAGKRFVKRGAELAATDGSYLYAYSPAATSWFAVDRVPDAAMTWSTRIDTFDGVSSADVALSNGRLVEVWRTGAPNVTSSAVWVQVSDASDGTIILAPTLLSSTAALGCRVVTVGSYVHVLWREGNSLLVRGIDPAFPSIGGVVTLRTDMDGNSGWDACAIGSTLVIAYENSAHALKLYSYTFVYSASYTQAATGGITGEAGNTFRRIAIDGASGDRIYVAYSVQSSTTTRVATANDSTLAQITAPVTLEAVASFFVTVLRQASGAVVGWNYQATPTGGDVARFTTCAVNTTLSVSSGSTRGTWGTLILSRMFAQGSRVFAIVSDNASSTWQQTYNGINSYLIEVETSESLASTYVPHRYLGKIDLLIGGGTDRGFLPSACAISATESLVPVSFLGAIPQAASNWRCGIRHVRVVTGASLPADMWRSTEYGNEAYISGALFSGYDGRAVFDYGIARPTVVGDKSNSAPSAGNIAAGTYLYGFVEEWRSAAGMLHRSATATVSQSSGASGTTTIYFRTCALTGKRGVDSYATATTPSVAPQYIVANRSVANGTTYQRLTFEPTYTVISKQWQNAIQSFADVYADSDITAVLTPAITLASRPVMYTTGGILDDDQPPNQITHVLHRSRIWGVAGDQRTIWFSKSFQDDLGVAPGFSSSFRITMEEDVTALWSMDEKLVIASGDRLWYLVGGDGGPNAAGQGSDIQGPYLIQTDVGCTNPRSVVSTPDGTMFESDGRIYLLTRGLEVVWIGRPVQDELASFPNITSAVLVPKKNQVRFTCNDAGGTAHKVVVYDYGEKQWTTFRYLGGTVAIADAVVHDGVYHLLTTAGAVYQETTGSYSLDAGSWVTMTLETAWISAAGPLAFQSVRRFALHGTSNSDHALTVSVGVDRSTSYSPAVTWASGSTVTTVGPLEAAELHLGKKCSSIRFKIVDASPGGSPSDGRGPAFDTMGIEVGVKKGFQKKPATKRG